MNYRGNFDYEATRFRQEEASDDCYYDYIYRYNAYQREIRRKKIRKSRIKAFLFFLIFEMFFTAITLPIMMFYGPFNNVKRIIVGASMNTLRHQYIAKLFLTDDAIYKILGNDITLEDHSSDPALSLDDKVFVHDDKLEIYNISGKSYAGKLMIIYNPSKVVLGYSGSMPQAGETVRTIAQKAGAVAAINAGGFVDQQWTGTGGKPMGFIMHDYNIIFNDKSENEKQDAIGLTSAGKLVVGKYSVKQLKLMDIKEGVSFGPPLVVDGKSVIKGGDGGWGIAPRTAIGQRKKDGAILFLTIDGRQIHSFGATLRDVQDIMLKYGAYTAVNLDGGSSSTMYYNGKVVNSPSDALGERAVPSAFMYVP